MEDKMWVNLVAMLVMTITDRILDRTKPTGVDKEVWRAQVQAAADAEEDWLKKEIDKHSS